ENLNVAAQYTEVLTAGEVDSIDDIELAQGAVVRHGLTKVAVYRDDDACVHSMSAVCVHLGCIVTWNGVEKTWDCPCHGSRFDALGVVINGPANSDFHLRRSNCHGEVTRRCDPLGRIPVSKDDGPALTEKMLRSGITTAH